MVHNLTSPGRKVTGSSQGQAGVTQILSVGLRCKETPRGTIGCSQLAAPCGCTGGAPSRSRSALIKFSPVLFMKPAYFRAGGIAWRKEHIFPGLLGSFILKLYAYREGSLHEGMSSDFLWLQQWLA